MWALYFYDSLIGHLGYAVLLNSISGQVLNRKVQAVVLILIVRGGHHESCHYHSKSLSWSKKFKVLPNIFYLLEWIIRLIIDTLFIINIVSQYQKNTVNPFWIETFNLIILIRDICWEKVELMKKNAH